MNWQKFLFNHKTPVTHEEQTEIFSLLKIEYELFRDNYPEPVISEKREKELNDWYFNEGQTVLKDIYLTLWKQLYALSNTAMPAHDARHAIFRVPISALEFIESEDVSNWCRIGVLGALCHDWGRWSEEHIFGGPQESSAHSRMSFVLTREFLMDYHLPPEIVWHILYSVIIHTKGVNEDAPMPVKLTVAADREQLWGPEFVLRMLHHVRDKGCMKIYQDDEYTKDSIRNKIEYIYINRFMGPLHSRNNHLAVLRGRLLQFLYLSGEKNFQDNITLYAREHQSWLPMNCDVLITEANNFTTDVTDPSVALEYLMNASHTATNTLFKEDAKARVLESPEHLHIHLAKAIMFNNHVRILEDNRVSQKLLELEVIFKDDSFLSTIVKNYISLV